MAIVGCTSVDNKRIVIHKDAMIQTLNNWGDYAIAGSGMSSFWGLLNHVESESPDIMPSGFHPDDRASTIFLRTAHMEAFMASEMLNHFGLPEAVGGFIESATANVDGFHRLQNDIFIFWDVFLNNGSISQPQIHYTRHYIDNNLNVSFYHSIQNVGLRYVIPCPSNVNDFEISDEWENISLRLNNISIAKWMIHISGTSKFRTVIQGGKGLKDSIKRIIGNNIIFKEEFLLKLLNENFVGIDSNELDRVN